MDNFRERYTDIQGNLPKLQEKYDEAKEDYKRLKKLQYNMALAQNAQYCYGPEYEGEKRTYGLETQEQSQKQRN